VIKNSLAENFGGFLEGYRYDTIWTRNFVVFDMLDKIVFSISLVAFWHSATA
jgi:hypothetical protein